MLGCVAPGPCVSSASYLTIDEGPMRTVFLRNWAPTVPIFPTKLSKRGDQYWSAGAEKIIDVGGQVGTLDVDDISRPLVLRGMVSDVRKTLVSGLELRTDSVVDNYGSRLVHRQAGPCAKLLERAGVPFFFFACSTSSANGHRGFTSLDWTNSGKLGACA